MNKKGFSLVELLAAVFVLSILAVIIAPNVINLISENEDALYDEQINNIVNASKKYMVEHSELLPEGNDYVPIYINDLIDSGVIDNDSVIDPKTKEQMNGCVVVNYNENFNQYEYNYNDGCSITITFDPEGGSVDTTSKQVMIGKTYGELPTPTREGYNFLGWCGKNMFSKDNTASISYVIFDGNSVIFDGSSVYNNTMTHIYIRGYENGTRVYDYLFRHSDIGFKSYVLDLPTLNNCNRIGLKINTTKRDSYFIIKNVLNKSKKYTLSYNSDIVDIDHARAVISNLQLEDGEVATSYEPYQEFTSDTIVKKGSNYTMHAIWEVVS